MRFQPRPPLRSRPRTAPASSQRPEEPPSAALAKQREAPPAPPRLATPESGGRAAAATTAGRARASPSPAARSRPAPLERQEPRRANASERAEGNRGAPPASPPSPGKASWGVLRALLRRAPVGGRAASWSARRSATARAQRALPPPAPRHSSPRYDYLAGDSGRSGSRGWPESWEGGRGGRGPGVRFPLRGSWVPVGEEEEDAEEPPVFQIAPRHSPGGEPGSDTGTENAGM